MRLGFVDGIVTVEHGADGGTIDLAHERGSFGERGDHIALGQGQSLYQNCNSVLAGVRGDAGETIDEVAGSIGAAESAGSSALPGRAEDQDALGAEIGAEVDQMADVLPTAAAQGGIGCGDMQPLRADHEPVQADELQALGGDDVAAFAAARGREGGGISSESERGDLDAAVTGLTDGAARIGEGPVLEDLVADGVAEAVRHRASIVMGGRGGPGAGSPELWK